MSLKRYYLKIIFIFLLPIIFIEKSYSIEPDVFVQSTVNRASEALGGKYTKQEKIDKLKNIARETVDINGIGSYTLGKHRKNLTPEQKKIYEDLSTSDIPNLWKPRKEHFLKVDDLPYLGTGKLDLKAIKTMAVEMTTN